MAAAVQVSDASRQGAPSCPIIKVVNRAVSTPLQVKRLEFSVAVHMSTALVNIRATYAPPAEEGVCTLFVPITQYATATACEVVMGQRIFETAVVPVTEVQRLAKENRLLQPGTPVDAPTSVAAVAPNQPPPQPTYDPNMFVLPLGVIGGRDDLNLTFSYFEHLQFEHGQYAVRLPTVIPTMPAEADVSNIVDVKVTINTGTTQSNWGNASHSLDCIHRSDTAVAVRSAPNQFWPNTPFDMSYTIWHDRILASALVEESFPADKSSMQVPTGNFCVFVTPPETLPPAFGRSIVFIIDRSGSMQGEPMDAAKKAVLQGVRSLTPLDHFTIIAFNEYQYFFQQSLVEASPENVYRAEQWLSQIYADGLTDIMTPLRRAVDMLTSVQQQERIPFVFLMTDGAVQNERDICFWAQSLRTNIRINTFGIGAACNQVFLKMLGTIGRGFFEVAYRSDAVYAQMVRLLTMTQSPILTDISLAIAKTAHNVELCPYPIPDLFAGAPLVLSGSYANQFPSTVLLQGRDAAGAAFRMEVPVSPAGAIPISKVFVKQRLDHLTAQAWLADSSRIRARAVELSVTESITCPYTCMVAYETNEERRREEAERKRAGRSKLYRRAGWLAVGGLAVVATTMLLFGDMAGSALGSIGGVDTCSECGGETCGGEGDCCGGTCGGEGGGGACGDCNTECNTECSADCNVDCGGCDC